MSIILKSLQKLLLFQIKPKKLTTFSTLLANLSLSLSYLTSTKNPYNSNCVKLIEWTYQSWKVFDAHKVSSRMKWTKSFTVDYTSMRHFTISFLSQPRAVFTFSLSIHQRRRKKSSFFQLIKKIVPSNEGK